MCETQGGGRNETNVITIDTDSVDSCEIFMCCCSGCSERFIMGCGDSKDMRYCPMCGVRSELLIL